MTNCPLTDAFYNPINFVPSYLSIHLPLKCLGRLMKLHGWCYLQHTVRHHLSCYGSCAWAPCLCGIMGVVAMVLSSSVWCHLCYGCRCTLESKLYCHPPCGYIMEGCQIRQPTLRWTGQTGSMYLHCTEVGT
jgi:hypothetical protein